MQKIKFTKMQGLGNDFILIMPEEFEKVKEKFPHAAIKLCDRRFGIGADGIFVPTLNEKDTDLGWLFYQSDGSTAQMCGNGMRCFARFVYDNKLVDKKKFSVKTGAGVIVPELLADGTVKVNMSKPVLEPKKIPFLGDTSLHYKLSAMDRDFDVHTVSMGNPHCVVFSGFVDKVDVERIGPAFENNRKFPDRTNTEFVRVVGRNCLKMRVWERGNGETPACGTGACAAAVAAVLNGFCPLGENITVKVRGGELIVNYTGETVYLTGTTSLLFEGVIEI